ncbi:hypothetical protein D3C83_56050 [compost metagenome]
MRRFWRLVAEPEGDHGMVNAVVKQVHRGRVTKDMWGNSLVPERRALLTRGRHMLRKQVLDAVAAQWAPPSIGEQRPSRICWRFAQPGA